MTKLVITLKKPDAGTLLVGAKVIVHNRLGAIMGIDHTDSAGKVEFNYPGAEVGAHIRIDGSGEIAHFDIPASGTLTTTVVLTEPAESAVPVKATWVAS
jgi:hypothetical protein